MLMKMINEKLDVFTLYFSCDSTYMISESIYINRFPRYTIIDPSKSHWVNIFSTANVILHQTSEIKSTYSIQNPNGIVLRSVHELFSTSTSTALWLTEVNTYTIHISTLVCGWKQQSQINHCDLCQQVECLRFTYKLNDCYL